MPLNFEGEHLEKLLTETQRPRYKHINTYLFMYQCLSPCTPSIYLEQNCPYLYLKGKPKTVDHRGLLVVRKRKFLRRYFIENFAILLSTQI